MLDQDRTDGLRGTTRPPGRTRTISRDDIVAAAEQLIRPQGAGAVTMRAIANRLGVTPMALYNHVSNKEEIISLLFARIDALTPPLRAIAGEAWPDTLRAHLIERWTHLDQFSGWASDLQSHTNLALGEQRGMEMIDFFREVGFPEAQAMLASSFLSTYLFGRMCLDDRMRGTPMDNKPMGLSRKDYVVFGVSAAIAGLRALLDEGKPG